MYPHSLFVEASKLTSRREDLFTLAVAACLSEDRKLLRAFLRRLLGSQVRQVLHAGSELTVRTQVTHSSPRCCLDMVVYQDGRAIIALEHKLLAPEGELQVKKYLTLPRKDAPRVAYIAGYYASAISGSEHSRYVRHPSGRLHFVWPDFYDLFATPAATTSRSGLREATKALFDEHLFQPTHWAVAGLKDPAPAVRAAAVSTGVKLHEITGQNCTLGVPLQRPGL